MPSFRMHLRARGKVAQVFKTLNDAPQQPVNVSHTDPGECGGGGKCAHLSRGLSSLQNLALCTAALMYILSRDRLNMDLDRSCLDLMIRLLELDQDQGGGADSSVQFSARELAKIKEKIRKLCDTVHNKHLDLQNITVPKFEHFAVRLQVCFGSAVSEACSHSLQTGHLAMETLLSLTSKRAGDWFKEELRLLGGLDHIVDKGELENGELGPKERVFLTVHASVSTVKECVENLDQEHQEEKLVTSLWGAERCLRVLDSVSGQSNIVSEQTSNPCMVPACRRWWGE